jgi:hypothetical protein
MPDDDQFGYSQRIYIGSRNPSGVRLDERAVHLRCGKVY